ncbi:MAG: YIP1 family protein [Vicinamibacterales bacterium]
MASTTVASGVTPAPMNLLARFIGIITAPRATFESVVAHPRILGMLLLTATISAVGAALPMTTDAGKQSTIDQQVKTMESFGMTVNDEMYASLQKRTGTLPYTTGGSVLVFTPIVIAIMAGILFAVYNGAMGGEAKYKQIYAVVVHAGVISAVGQLFTGPLNYFRGSVSSPTNLSALLPMLDEASFIGRLAGMVDLFIIWWLIVLAMGLAVLYRRKTQPTALTLFGIYAVIAVCVAAFMGR